MSGEFSKEKPWKCGFSPFLCYRYLMVTIHQTSNEHLKNANSTPKLGHVRLLDRSAKHPKSISGSSAVNMLLASSLFPEKSGFFCPK